MKSSYPPGKNEIIELQGETKVEAPIQIEQKLKRRKKNQNYKKVVNDKLFIKIIEFTEIHVAMKFFYKVKLLIIVFTLKMIT